MDTLDGNSVFGLQRFRREGGVHFISNPQGFEFEGGEEAYDEFIGGARRDDLFKCGRGAWQLAVKHSASPIKSIIEIGAGGGTCSLGLVAAAPTAMILITDTSPRFLSLIQNKLSALQSSVDNVAFATLAGEDLNQLPSECCDCIVIASALHHVGDWRAFLSDAVRVLRPGGTLVIQEPCREGNLMMGMALDFVLSPLWPEHAALSASDHERIVNCRESIFHLANSRVEKSGEDKHSFLALELAAGGRAAGFASSVFYSNYHFTDLTDRDLTRLQGTCSFIGYLDSFLDFHHRVSVDGLSKLRTHLYPVLQGLDDVFVAGDGAPLLGCMVFCR